MGDVAMSVPVVAQLCATYPDSEVNLLTPAFLHPLFGGIEGLRLIDPDLKGRHKGICGLMRLGWSLGKFDAVADLHNVLRTQLLRPIFALRGARIATIDKGRSEKRALTAYPNKVLKPLRTTLSRYCEVFERLGFTLPTPTPLPAPAAPISGAARAVLELPATLRIGVAPFAQHAGKIYPLPLMEQVIAELAKKEGVRIFLFGGGAHERAEAERIAALYPEQVTSLIGTLKLGEELEVIRGLDCMVSMDSSAMHMASLVGTRTVSIWGATHPYAGFYGMGQATEDAVGLELDCRPCSIYGNKPCRWGDLRCLHQISPKTVVERILNPPTAPSA